MCHSSSNYLSVHQDFHNGFGVCSVPAVNVLMSYIPNTSPIEMKMKRLNVHHCLKEDTSSLIYLFEDEPRGGCQ